MHTMRVCDFVSRLIHREPEEQGLGTSARLLKHIDIRASQLSIEGSCISSTGLIHSGQRLMEKARALQVTRDLLALRRDGGVLSPDERQLVKASLDSLRPLRPRALRSHD